MRKILFSVALSLAAIAGGAMPTLTVKPIDVGDLTKCEITDVQRIDLTDNSQAVVMLKDGSTVRYSTRDYLLVFTPVESDGIDEVETALQLNDLRVWVDESAVYIAGAHPGDDLALFNVGGMMLARGTAVQGVSRIDVSSLSNGIYIVRAGHQAVKIIKQ